jgi:hypothetical protein
VVPVEIVKRVLTEKLTKRCETVYIFKVLADLLDSRLAELRSQGKHGEIDHQLTRVCDRDIP